MGQKKTLRLIKHPVFDSQPRQAEDASAFMGSADAKSNSMDTMPKQIAALIGELGGIAPRINDELELKFKEFLCHASREQLAETLQLVKCKNGFHTFYLNKVKAQLTLPPLTAPPKQTAPKIQKPSFKPKKKKHKPQKFSPAAKKKLTELDRMLKFSANQRRAKIY